MVDSLDVCETVPVSTDGERPRKTEREKKKNQLWMLSMLFLYTFVPLSSSNRFFHFFPLPLFPSFFPVYLQPVFYSNCNNENITIIAKQ